MLLQINVLNVKQDFLFLLIMRHAKEFVEVYSVLNVQVQLNAQNVLEDILHQQVVVKYVKLQTVSHVFNQVLKFVCNVD